MPAGERSVSGLERAPNARASLRRPAASDRRWERHDRTPGSGADANSLRFGPVKPREVPPAGESLLPPERGVPIDRQKAIAVALPCWAGWGAMIWAVLDQRTAAMDRAGLTWFRDGPGFTTRAPAYLLEAIRDVTALGGVLLTTLTAIAAIVALLFLRLRREAVLLGMTVALGWGLNNAMKALIGRERPDLVPHLTPVSGLSFPSAHAFASAMVYIGMALAFACLSRSRAARYALVGTAMALSALIAWSRVLLGVHHPSDVVAGWLGGAGWAFLAAALLNPPSRSAASQ